jgi:hypothetical protein
MIDEKRLGELGRHCKAQAYYHIGILPRDAPPTNGAIDEREWADLIQLARLGLWAREHGVAAMRRGSKWLDGIKYDLEASVYSVEDDEFSTVFATRDDLDLALAALPKERG